MSEAKIRAAIEIALNGMAGMVAITSSSVAAATVIATPAPHGLSTGAVVSIVGHIGSTPSIDGTYVVTVTGVSTFTIPKTVTVAGTGGAFTLTAWENWAFSPPASTVPYQRVWFLDFLTFNPEMSKKYSQIRSYFQIDLLYPIQQGDAAVQARAALIKALFFRGASFVNGGVTVTIEKTPTVGAGVVDVNMWKRVVKVPYQADIFI